MPRVGVEFPPECPGCGGEILLIPVGRQEPVFIEPDTRSRRKAARASFPRNQALTHLCELPEVAARLSRSPTDKGELAQAHDNRDMT